MANLIRLQTEGLVGPDERFHINGWGKAAVDLITHAHGDHARLGSDEHWCAEDRAPPLRHRMGRDIRVKALRYGVKEPLQRDPDLTCEPFEPVPVKRLLPGRRSDCGSRTGLLPLTRSTALLFCCGERRQRHEGRLGASR